MFDRFVMDYTHFFYKEVFYKEGSTRIGKNLRNSSTESETTKEFDFSLNLTLRSKR